MKSARSVPERYKVNPAGSAYQLEPNFKLYYFFSVYGSRAGTASSKD